MSSVSSYNPMKENVHTTFGSSLSLQSSTARSLTKDIPNVHKTFMKVHSSHCEGAKQLCGSYHVDLCRRWGVGFIQQRRLDLHLAKVCSSPLPVLCYNPVPVLHILWPSSSSSSPLFFSLISFHFVFVLGYPIFNNL